VWASSSSGPISTWRATFAGDCGTGNGVDLVHPERDLVEVADQYHLILASRDFDQLIDVHRIRDAHCHQLGIVRLSEEDGLGDCVRLTHVWDAVTPEYYQVGNVGTVATVACQQLLACDLEGVGHICGCTHVRNGVHGTEKL